MHMLIQVGRACPLPSPTLLRGCIDVMLWLAPACAPSRRRLQRCTAAPYMAMTVWASRWPFGAKFGSNQYADVIINVSLQCLVQWFSGLRATLTELQYELKTVNTVILSQNGTLVESSYSLESL